MPVTFYNALVLFGEAQRFGVPDVIVLTDLTNDLRRDPFRVLVLLVVQFHFEVQIGFHTRSTLKADGAGQAGRRATVDA